MYSYYQEPFTPEEAAVLGRFFTNTDRPVFALINLPEVVKGALFARYSRSPKSLRRLFLDEFVSHPETGIQAISARLPQEDHTAALKRAEGLYERVFSEYGDDSVAQLGGAHLACEQASNILTKVLEWGRLGAYLEQSTRYIYYDRKFEYPDGRRQYRYFVPPEIEAVPELAARYQADMDWLFGMYSELVRGLTAELEKQFPLAPGDPKPAWAAAIRAKACDAARGLLPAATLSNLGIYATGQSYEMMLLRMRVHPLQEARDYADMMLSELREVIPAFLRRVDVPERGGVWSKYLADSAQATQSIAANISSTGPASSGPDVKLVEWDPEAETKVVAAALFPYSDLPDDRLLEIAGSMSTSEREQVLRGYAGDRTNRRHKPGRAFERTYYRFDILCDFGAFRDLQRHRMLTIEWQRLGTKHGHTEWEGAQDAGRQMNWEAAMARMASLHEIVVNACGAEAAQYTVPFAYRVRFTMQLNAREAMHLLELRTSPQGHVGYRRVCQEMHRLIRDKAGHRLIADAMKFVDYSEPGLERLEAEKRSLGKRRAAGQADAPE